MKIAIFHPQINNYGGGEFVALIIASILSKANDVEVISSYKADRQKLEKFFCLKLSKLNFNVRNFSKLIQMLPSITSYKSSLQIKLLADLNKYDLVIDTGTNGWFTKKLKCKTICYVHFPFFQPRKKGWKKITNFLLVSLESAFQYDKIICNSQFTKMYVDQMANKNAEVIYPPVQAYNNKLQHRKNIIVSIGRFTYEKKHEVMIDSFKKMNKKGWELHLIGSFQDKILIYDKHYLNTLEESAKNFPIFFHINMPHNNVLDFLGKSRIYWHARGYGETDPNEYENFGITTVESMAAGCVPVVINKGAQPEIVEHKKNGFVWNETDELIKYTLDLINNKKLMKKLSNAAIKKSKKYSSRIFERKILRVVKDVMRTE